MLIIIVLPKDRVDEWLRLCGTYAFAIRHEIGIGGSTRFHSVKKNLAGIPDHCLVAVHDGVRPLVSLDTIDRCFSMAKEHGNAIPCIEIPETLRFMDGQENRQVDRSQYRLIQTPQVFESGILKKAYRQEFKPHFTDDAGVVESLGYRIQLVPGNPENMKITLKKDIKIAAALI
jgi:2-C-methyl-D-erythritol 4-phosphate cytidylyltransferase